jgi:L-ascorbate metabolism protein UlaG (beta-lactamase superfamily)
MLRRSLRWVLGVTAFVVVAIGALLLWPARDMARYEDYYVNDPTPPSNGAVRVTFLGTSTLLLDDGTTKLMVDGFISRPSRGDLARGLGRVRTDTASVDRVLGGLKACRIDALFTVHSHYDHALDAAYISRLTGADLYGSKSTRMVGIGGNVDTADITVIIPGKMNKVGAFHVIPLQARHSKQLELVSFLGDIEDTLRQPASVRDYKEGGSFDLLIQHGNHRILIKPGPALNSESRDTVRADVVFLGIGTLGKRSATFKKAYYEESVRALRATHVIPIHWDDFLAPLSDDLPTAPLYVDTNPHAAFRYIIDRARSDSIGFQILQGFSSVLLFAPNAPPAERPSPYAPGNRNRRAQRAAGSQPSTGPGGAPCATSSQP